MDEGAWTATSAPDGTQEATRSIAADILPDDWAIVSKMHEDGLKAACEKRPESRPIRFREAYSLLRSDESSWRPHLGSIKRVSGHVKTGGFSGFLWSCLHTEIKESSADFEDRDFVLALNFVTLDHRNEVHRRIMISIYRKLVKLRREDPDPPTIGPMWADLGFQGSDPGTDLRSTGIFGPLQVLYLLEYYPVLGGTMYKVAVNPIREFPFALVAFNFSGVVMDVLKERGLHDCIHHWRKEAGTVREDIAESALPSVVDAATGAISGGCSFGSALWTPPPVIHATCDLLVGCLFEFFAEWVKIPARSISDFGPMKSKLREHIRGNVSSILKNCDRARDRRTVLDLESPAHKRKSQIQSTDKQDEALEFHDF